MQCWLMKIHFPYSLYFPIVWFYSQVSFHMSKISVRKKRIGNFSWKFYWSSRIYNTLLVTHKNQFRTKQRKNSKLVKKTQIRFIKDRKTWEVHQRFYWDLTPVDPNPPSPRLVSSRLYNYINEQKMIGH